MFDSETNRMDLDDPHDPRRQDSNPMDPASSAPQANEASLVGDTHANMDEAIESGSVVTNASEEEMSQGSVLGGYASTLGPEDSVSQRPPRSMTSEALSVTSLHDEDELFREAFGRTFNAKCDSYLLPADGEEHSRHDVQHRILQLMLNSLYMPADLVRNALRPSSEWEFPAIFDVGTGSGRWAIDMALEFPHCEVVGLDLVPPGLGGVEEVPLNCRFEVDDANLSLEHYTDCFNVVHSRAIDPGISNFESFLYNVAQTLRPHGVLLLCSGTPQLFDENLEPCLVLEEGQPGFTWSQRFWAAIYTAYNNLGNTAGDAAIYWDDWLQVNPNYENVRSRDVYIPVGPWVPGMDDRQRYVAELMRWNIANVTGSYEALLIADGYKPEVAERLIKSSQREMQELTAHTYLRWRYTWAERRDSEWEERLERQPIIGEPAHPSLLPTRVP